MTSIRSQQFTLETEDFRFFNRRILYLSLKFSNELEQLRQKIGALFPDVVNPKSKPFLPHITVKRWQRYEFNQLTTDLSQRVFPSHKFIVNEICLFKSAKNELNEKYHVIKRVGLLSHS